MGNYKNAYASSINNCQLISQSVQAMNRLAINQRRNGGSLGEANVRFSGSMSTTSEQRVARMRPGFSGTRVNHHDNDFYTDISTDNGAHIHNER